MSSHGRLLPAWIFCSFDLWGHFQSTVCGLAKALSVQRSIMFTKGV